MKNFTIPFGYNVFNGEEYIFSDTCTMALSESDIKKVADILQQNGCHPEIMGDLPDLSDKVLETIFDNNFCDRLPEGVNLEDIFVELDEKMPDELLAVVEDVLQFKSADIRFYYQVNGKEKYGHMMMGISVSSFKKMVDAVAEDHHGLSDFDFLKEFAPEAFEEVNELAQECAYKECYSLYGATCVGEIREFPVEVYDYV